MPDEASPPSSDRARDCLALAAIFAVFGLASLWVGAGANVPVIDDWLYAWSVEHFLKTGRLRVPEFSAVYPIAQIAWGALFARVAGFSFGALRFSTVVLAAFGCWAVYLTLREMGCRWWRSDWRSAVRPAALPLGTTVATMVVLRSALSRALGPLDWAAIREEQLRWWFLVPFTRYANWNVKILIESAFPLARPHSRAFAPAGDPRRASRQHHPPDRVRVRKSAGRDPPRHLPLQQLAASAPAFLRAAPTVPLRPTAV